jgi:hypothetical protein
MAFALAKKPSSLPALCTLVYVLDKKGNFQFIHKQRQMWKSALLYQSYEQILCPSLLITCGELSQVIDIEQFNCAAPSSPT